MDFHVIIPTEQQLVMLTTEGGYVHQVWPAPPTSLPGGAIDQGFPQMMGLKSDSSS